MAEITREQVVDYLSNLPVIQIAELVKELEGKWGVSAAPVAVAAPGGGAGAAAAAVEEKTEFDVILVDGGASTINVIKAEGLSSNARRKANGSECALRPAVAILSGFESAAASVSPHRAGPLSGPSEVHSRSAEESS
jgi:hypothetical protein